MGRLWWDKSLALGVLALGIFSKCRYFDSNWKAHLVKLGTSTLRPSVQPLDQLTWICSRQYLVIIIIFCIIMAIFNETFNVKVIINFTHTHTCVCIYIYIYN